MTGIARCSGCRYCLQATKTSRGKRIYRCSRTRAGGICPAPTRVLAEPAEAAVAAAFWAITENLEAEGREDDDGAIALLERELVKAERALEQWTSPEVQDEIGDLATYAKGLRLRRARRDDLQVQLDGAGAADRGRALPNVQTLRAAWGRMTAQERRELLALRFDCLALRRDRSIVVYPAGTGPTDLPRRGFTEAPVLRPFPDPPSGARVLALEEPGEPVRDRGV